MALAVTLGDFEGGKNKAIITSAMAVYEKLKVTERAEMQGDHRRSGAARCELEARPPKGAVVKLLEKWLGEMLEEWAVSPVGRQAACRMSRHRLAAGTQRLSPRSLHMGGQ